MNTNKKDFIIIGSIDWQTNWQTQHRLVSSLVLNKNRVLFIENTGIRNLNINDTSRLLDRLKNRKKSINGFNEIYNGLNLFSPIIFPFPYSRIIIKINKLLFFRGLSKWLKFSKFNNPIIISFLPTPLIDSLIEFLQPDLSIYYCANEMQGMNKIVNKKLEISENKFFSKSDLVFVTSSNLYNKATKFNKNVSIFPAAVEMDKFNINDKFNLPDEFKLFKNKKVIGYIGAITKVLDINLVNYLISHMKEYIFVFIGRPYVDINQLLKHSNFVHISEKKHSEIPNYLNFFDSCLIPYKVNQFTNSVYSCKINEYLALGKPIVSSNMTEIKNFNKINQNIIYISQDRDDFLKKITLSINENNSDKVDLRVNIAKSNSWENKFNEINSVIYNHNINESKIDFNWKKNYKKYINKIQNLFISLSFSFVIIFFILFYSPLINKLSDKLIISDKLEQSEAIVLFTGYGSLDYINILYQDRVKEVLELYKKGYAKKIYLSGRKQTFYEQEIVKSLLLNYGVPINAIIYKNVIFKNTYDEILQMNILLDKDNIRNFIFITSPYHSLRSKLIWNKNFPDYDIKFYVSEDKLVKNKRTFFQKINLYKIIVYEYLAIFFNKINKRL